VSKGIRDSLQDCIDCTLGIREELGLELHSVTVVERRWSEGEPGRGQLVSEKQVIMDPSPYIVDLSHNFRMLEGGNYQQGDLMIKQVSKNQFSKEEQLSMVTDRPDVERFLVIDGKRYTGHDDQRITK